MNIKRRLGTCRGCGHLIVDDNTMVEYKRLCCRLAFAFPEMAGDRSQGYRDAEKNENFSDGVVDKFQNKKVPINCPETSYAVALALREL